MDLDRLAKLLGMIGSNADGEALTAAGMTWFDVICPSASGASDWTEPETVAEACAACLRSGVNWTYREASLLSHLPGFRRASEKQLVWLESLVDRARLAAGAAAPTAPPAWATPSPEPPPRKAKTRSKSSGGTAHAAA
jgi:hypothetical protein